MASRDVTIRLSAQGLETVKRGLMQLGDDGQRALKRITDVNTGPSNGLRALNEVTEAARDRLRDMGAEAGVAGRVLASFGPAGFTAAAGAGALVAELVEIVKAAGEAEEAQNRLVGALRATGGTAGLTVKQLSELAEEVSSKSLFDDDEVKRAEATLLRFSSVQGDVFKRAIKQSADLAAATGGDLTSAAEAMGRALENPAEGLGTLTRAFPQLRGRIEETAKAMAQAGVVSGAQRLIQDEFAKSTSGLAEAQTQGLLPSLKLLRREIGDLQKDLGKDTPFAGWLESAANGLRRFVTESRQGIEALRTVVRVVRNPEQAQREDFDRQEQQAHDENVARVAAQKKADDDAAAARQRRTDAVNKFIAVQQRDLELARQDANLAAQRAAGDRAVADLLQKVPSVQKPDQDRVRAMAEQVEREKQLRQERAEAARQAESDAKRADEEWTRFLDQSQQALDQYDKSEQSLADGILKNIAPWIEYGKQLDIIARLHREGYLTAVQRAAAEEAAAQALADSDPALRAAAQALDDYTKAVDQANQEWEDSFIQIDDSANGINNTTHRLGLTFGSAFENAISGGKGFRDVLRGILSDLERLAARKLVTEPLFNAIGGALPGIGNWISGFMRGSSDPTGSKLASETMQWLGTSKLHLGGIAGSSGGQRALVPASAFMGAPRYHSGGIAGLAPDEVPAILRRGERVVPNGATPAGGKVSVVVNNNGQPVEAKATTRHGPDGIEILLDLVASDIAAGGRTANAISSSFGVQRSLATR